MKNRPASYEELKESITRSHTELSKQLQRIARFALEKPNDLALGTVATVAAASGAQPSAVIRFANTLGFKGFSEMQQIFRNHLVSRSVSYRERIDQMRRHTAASGGTPTGVLHEVVSQAISVLGHLEETVNATDMEAAVQTIASAENVYVLAQRRAFPIACYMSYALNQLELRAHLLDGVGGMLREWARAINPGDALIVASFRNYSPDVIDTATACHRRGAAVIAITDTPLSPLRPAADICFELGGDSDRPFRSLVSPMSLAQALVVSTGYYLTERQPTRTRTRARKEPN
jgi:DNA-binding MurR/RpiR family transcriptional regulator